MECLPKLLLGLDGFLLGGEVVGEAEEEGTPRPSDHMFHKE